VQLILWSSGLLLFWFDYYCGQHYYYLTLRQDQQYAKTNIIMPRQTLLLFDNPLRDYDVTQLRQEINFLDNMPRNY
jgi:hypothetical protein